MYLPTNLGTYPGVDSQVCSKKLVLPSFQICATEESHVRDTKSLALSTLQVCT